LVSPANTTTYSITKSNGGCFDTKTATLTVNQLPTIFVIASNTLICSLQSVTLSAGGASSYTWSPYGGNTSQAIVSPTLATTFTVQGFDGTCTGSTTMLISTNPNPTVSIVASPTAVCAGSSVSLTVNGADTYLWTNPSSLGTSTFITHAPAGATNFQVTGTNTLTGCSASASQVVLVKAVPVLTVAATKTMVCVSGPSTLTVKGDGVYSYLWSSGPTTTATIVNPANTMIYNVTATNPQTGCKSTSLVTVNVFQPSVTVNTPTASCVGGIITLMASGATTYTWTGMAPGANVQVAPSTGTFYVVNANTTSTGVSCPSSNTVIVTIYPMPTITAAPHRTVICANETTSLIAGGGATYTWSTLQVGSAVPVNPVGQTNYTVTGTDQNGCKSTATVQVKVSPCTGITEFNDALRLLVYPNPGSGEFVVHAPFDIELTLVNELGQTIMQIQLNEMNDRTVPVQNISSGIYFISGSAHEINVRQKIIITR
jgi:hypothetical protein